MQLTHCLKCNCQLSLQWIYSYVNHTTHATLGKFTHCSAYERTKTCRYTRMSPTVLQDDSSSHQILTAVIMGTDWRYNIDTTAKQAAMVWACAAKRRHWLGEEMYGIWGGGLQTKSRPKRTWKEVVQKDCPACNLNKEDAMDRGRWKKLIKIGWWSRWWVGECFFCYRLTRVVPDKGP